MSGYRFCFCGRQRPPTRSSTGRGRSSSTGACARDGSGSASGTTVPGFRCRWPSSAAGHAGGGWEIVGRAADTGWRSRRRWRPLMADGWRLPRRRVGRGWCWSCRRRQRCRRRRRRWAEAAGGARRRRPANPTNFHRGRLSGGGVEVPGAGGRRVPTGARGAPVGKFLGFGRPRGGRGRGPGGAGPGGCGAAPAQASDGTGRGMQRRSADGGSAGDRAAGMNPGAMGLSPPITCPRGGLGPLRGQNGARVGQRMGIGLQCGREWVTVGDASRNPGGRAPPTQPPGFQSSPPVA